MPINKAAEDDWLDAVAEDEPTDVEWMMETVERKKAQSDSYRYLAWMTEYTYPEHVKREIWQVACMGCGVLFTSGPMKSEKGRVIKSGKTLVMDKVETHILRGHEAPKKTRRSLPKECPF